MARGWESKSVESQMDDAEDRKKVQRVHLTPEQQTRQREVESLQLSRARVVHDLQGDLHPRHRASLEAGLKFLDDKIRALDS
jgi:hypothetical protein